MPSSPRSLALSLPALSLLYLLIWALAASAAPIDDAAKDWASGDARSATRRLKLLLQQSPDDPAARMLLGQIQLQSGDATAAEFQLERAIRLGAAEADALPLLIEALLAQDKYERALQLTEPTADLPAAMRARLLFLRGKMLLATDDPGAARAAFKQARAVDAGAVEPLLGLAQLASKAGDAAQARRFVEQATTSAPENADAWRTLGDIEYHNKNFDAAVAAYDKALKAAPKHRRLHYRRGLALLETEHAIRAWKDVEALTSIDKRFPGRFYLQGRLLLRENKAERALINLERYLETAPEDPDGAFYVALSLYRLGRNAQAEDHLARLNARYPDNADVALLLARIRIANHDAAGAEALLRPFSAASDASLPILEALRAALVQQRKTEEAAALTERAARRYPESPSAQMAYAEMLMRRGEPDLAVKTLRPLVKGDREADRPRTLLIRALLLAGKSEQASAVANAILKAYPQSASAHMLTATLLSQQGDIDGARAAFERSRELAGDDIAQMTSAVLAQAALEIMADRTGAARALLQELLAQEPGQTEAALALAALARRQAETDAQDMASRSGAGDAAFIEALTQRLEAAPDNLELRIALANAELGAGRAEAALDTLRRAPAAQAAAPQQLALRAQTEFAAGHPDLAKVTLARLAEQQPNSAQVRYRQADVSAATGDMRATQVHLADGLQLDRGGTLAANRLGSIVARLPNSDQREEFLTELRRVAPDHAAVRAVNAEHALARRDFAAAIGTFEALRRTYPEQEIYRMKLAGALDAAGRNRQAVRVLQEWVDQHPEQIEPRFLMARLQTSGGEQRAAIEQYRAIIELRNDDPVALNSLARLLAEQNPREALAYAERAQALRPDDPAYLDTMGMVLLALGDAEQARDLLGRAHANSPAPGTAFRYAKALAASGDSARARRILLRLQTRSFPERSQAEALLRQLAQAR